jgi:hypothetical protein
MREQYTLPKQRWGLRSKAEKRGVPVLRPKQRQRKKVLIMGSGRCGTSSLALNLQELGLDVQDERMGADGTAGLWFIPKDAAWYPWWPWDPTRCYPGCRRSDFTFDVILHVVRDPRHVIPAMGKVFPGIIWEWFEDTYVIPLRSKPKFSQLERCAFAWYYLNKYAEEQADYTFRIEDVATPGVQKRLRALLGLSTGTPWPGIVARNKHTGYRRYEPLDMHKLADVNPALCANVYGMAARYGYGMATG